MIRNVMIDNHNLRFAMIGDHKKKKVTMRLKNYDLRFAPGPMVVQFLAEQTDRTRRNY